jgi:predicted PurR-regulated permease PerM
VNENTPSDAAPSIFERRLIVVTCSVLLVYLTFHLLRELAALFQPLLIAGLITYMAYPIHHWLVEHHVNSKAAHFVLLGGVLLFFFGVGRLAQGNVEDLAASWETYQKRLDGLLAFVHENSPFPLPELEGKQLRDIIKAPTVDQLLEPARQVVGTFTSFLTSAFVVILYMVFLAAEVFSFPARARIAFGQARCDEVMRVIHSVNVAVGGYLAVMTLINFLIGLLTFIILALFNVPFAPLWGLLMFLFCYIPYIGSIIVTIAALVLCLIQYASQPLMVLFIGVLLIAVQQALGTFLQPRLMGNRLGVSPLLILLALAFWGIVWGIIGMLLAVPLLMVLKITLENIPETKPIAVLMSNP